jgi:hypothetical protein
MKSKIDTKQDELKQRAEILKLYLKLKDLDCNDVQKLMKNMNPIPEKNL